LSGDVQDWIVFCNYREKLVFRNTVFQIRSVQTEFMFVDCEVLPAKTMKNSENLDVTPCKSRKMHTMKQTANRAYLLAIYFFETSVDINRSAEHYVPSILARHCLALPALSVITVMAKSSYHNFGSRQDRQFCI
jgi:hypothetical protein